MTSFLILYTVREKGSFTLIYTFLDFYTSKIAKAATN